MKKHLGGLLLLTLALSGVRAWSQTDSSGQSTDTAGQSIDTQNTTPGPKVAYNYPDSAAPMSFLSDATENSSITLGIGGGATYISNVSATSVNNASGILYQVRPSIKLQQFRPKLSMMIKYTGGLQERSYFGNSSSLYDSQVTLGQNAGADILWQFAPRWQMHAYDQYLHSADPFDSYLTTSGIPTASNPNPVTYAPLAVYSQNMGVLALTNQLTSHDTLTYTGTETFRRINSYGTFTSPFQNMISYGGRADYSHQLSARLSLGVGYEFDSYDFGHGLQRSGVQSIKFSSSYLIRPNMNISIWVGPEYSAVKSIVQVLFFTEVVHQTQWNVTAGASFGWRDTRNAVRGSFNHLVSAGSYLLGTSSIYEVRGDYSRVLTSRWNVMAGLEYLNDVSISFSKRTLEDVIGDATLTRQLRHSLSADLRYAYVHQNQQNIYVGRPAYSTNQVGVTIQYSWNHPLGR